MDKLSPSTIQTDTTGAKILIINDNSADIDALRLLLEPYHYLIFFAHNIQEGLLKTQQHTPKIILLKNGISGMTGQQIYHNLKQQQITKSTPILFIDDESNNDNTASSTLMSKTACIKKPFCQTRIRDQIESHILLSTLQSQLNEPASNDLPAEPLVKKTMLPRVGENKKHDNDMYRMLVQTSPDAILVGCSGDIVYANNAAVLLYHATSIDDLLGKSLISLTSAESQMNATIAFHELEQLNQVHSQEEKALCLDQQCCDVIVTRLRFYYAGQPAVQMVVRDISSRKQLESQLHFHATHDGITGLPNRNLFSDRITQAISYAQRHQSELLVCFIDLDRFKRINDTMGHETGDQILVCIADRISSCIRSTDTVARIDSDEFALLLPFTNNKQHCLNIMHNVLAAVSKPITVKNQQTIVTCSIGYSHYPYDSRNETDLLKFADTARYHAKENGRNTIQHYNVLLQTLADEQARLEEALSHALSNNELSLHYQVQAELTNGSITGIEALLRWQNPELGFISPAQFIPIAEQTGQIENITKWILKTVCQQNKHWQQQGCKVVPIAVNISATSLRNPTQLETLVTQCLKDSELDPTLLELEFTESASMDDPESVIPLMLRLKALGISLAIDDFGTGYSNLRYLKQLPIDKLKLDGSFVQEIATEPRSVAIVEAIITMATQLGLTVIAEMAETEQQIKLLADKGCNRVQGYYFSKPLPASECKHLLDGRLMQLPYPSA